MMSEIYFLVDVVASMPFLIRTSTFINSSSHHWLRFADKTSRVFSEIKCLIL